MKQKITQNRDEFTVQSLKGQRWLVEERDACGVGFIAYQDGRSTHQLVEQALNALGCMEHRGGCSADGNSGDGSGVMTSLPNKVFAPWFAERNLEMPATEAWGVGMVFLPQENELATECKNLSNEL